MKVMVIELVIPDGEVEGAEKIVQEDVFQHYACFSWSTKDAEPHHEEWYREEYEEES